MRPQAALQCLSYRRLEILIAAKAGVDDFPLAIHHDHERCCRRVEGIGRIALGVEDNQMLKLDLRRVSFHASGCLVH